RMISKCVKGTTRESAQINYRRVGLDNLCRGGDAMDYFTKVLFRPALFAFSILLCLGSLVRTADATVVCTRTDSLGTQTFSDGSVDTCTANSTLGGTSASATAGAGGGNTATSTSMSSGTSTS